MTVLAGRYVLAEMVGSGGMADVFRAFDQVLERDVAVKVLRSPTTDAAARARFSGEARTVAALNHPGVVTVLDAGVQDGDPYLVMELVAGPSLSRHLHETGTLDAAATEALAVQLAEALACAHAHGLVHRDVKPGNILLRPNGTAVLTDFGIARYVDDVSTATSAGDVIGSPAYLSPEQVNGQPVSGAVDVYALGLVLLEAYTGIRAYPGPPVEAAIARLTAPPSVPVSLPLRLRSLLQRMTALEPAARPTAAEIVAELTGVAVAVGAPEATQDTALAVDPPTMVATIAPPVPRRRRTGPLVAITAAAAAALVLGISQLQPSRVDADTTAPAPTPSPSSTPAPVAARTTPTPAPDAKPVAKKAAAPEKAKKAAAGKPKGNAAGPRKK